MLKRVKWIYHLKCFFLTSEVKKAHITIKFSIALFCWYKMNVASKMDEGVVDEVVILKYS